MTFKKDGKEWGTTLEPSPAMLDPVLRLAAAATKNAIDDLQSRDPVAALDAFLWLAYGDAAIFLQVLGINVEPVDLLRRLGEGLIYAN